jgi:hypothetical protein
VRSRRICRGGEIKRIATAALPGRPEDGSNLVLSDWTGNPAGPLVSPSATRNYSA